MADPAATLRAQLDTLADHVRDPATHAAPAGVEDRRLKVYRDLFLNGIDALLAGNFPVIRLTLGDAGWRALVAAFYATHRSRTPLFTEVAREFIACLEARAGTDAGDPPWLAELAHYEWVELALQISEAPAPERFGTGDDLLDVPVALSPLAWVLAYAWPVHRIGPGFQPSEAPEAPTLLLVRRDAAGTVHFSELSPLTWRLLELASGEEARTGRALLTQLAREADAPDAARFVSDGHAMLRRLAGEGTVARPPSAA
ncbi:DUF2063 domain-containing protein [Luteimonas pelagia]